jgi:hypothetical protein
MKSAAPARTRQSGTYTRYGDVRPLLTDFDVAWWSSDPVKVALGLISFIPAVPRAGHDYFFLANGLKRYGLLPPTAAPSNRYHSATWATYPYPSKTFPLMIGISITC